MAKQPNNSQRLSQRARKRITKKTQQTSEETQTKEVTNAIQQRFTQADGVIELRTNTSTALTANKDSWGDKLMKKKDGFMRLASRNIGGIGVYAGNSKEEELKSWIVNSEFDIFGLQELNLNIKKCRDKERIGERMKTPAWEYYKTSTAHNKHYDGDKQMLFGGNMLLAQGQHCHHISSTGADEKGLGRWSWFLLNGKNNIKTRIVSAYRPCKTRNINNPGTVYNQHLKYFKDNNIDTCPLQMFDDDLLTLIRKWIRYGEKVVLMIDSNEDINTGTFNTKLRQSGLISALRKRHGPNTPPTQHSGSVVIDDIYVTPNLVVGKSGYLPFGDGPGDHRGLYVDIQIQSLIGGNIKKYIDNKHDV